MGFINITFLLKMKEPPLKDRVKNHSIRQKKFEQNKYKIFDKLHSETIFGNERYLNLNYKLFKLYFASKVMKNPEICFLLIQLLT